MNRPQADRYFLPQLDAQGLCEITGDEHHHLARVMRHEPGDRIVVFDGKGNEADAEIVTINKSRAGLRVAAVRHDAQDLPPRVVLAVAVPKSDRFRWLVEKATELGVERLVPLQTARSVVLPGSLKLEKMRKVVIEACKQSGRNRLMTIEPPMDWQQFAAAIAPAAPVFLADRDGEPAARTLRARTEGGAVTCIVGPEGGLTDAERRQALDAGAVCVSLGRRILRVETAAIVLAALVGLREGPP